MIYQRDYILRIIEELGQVLTIVLRLARGGRHDEALATINGALERAAGLSLRDLLDLPVERVVPMLQYGMLLRATPAELAAQLQGIARLVQEAGDLYAATGSEADRDLARLRALDLSLVALELDETLASSAAAVEALGRQLADYQLPAATTLRRFRHEEREERFDRAEDRLFELLDDPAAAEDALALGLAFCERLLARSDTELARGRLPRDEVESLLAELRERGATAAER